MTNQDILILAVGGFLNATAHCLPAEEFYKWHRFRRDVNRAVQDLARQEQELSQECGLPEAGAKGETRYRETYAKILKEEAAVAPAERIPLSFYKALYDENKTDKRDILADIAVETVLLDNLFSE